MKRKMVGNVPGNILGTLEDILCKIRKGVITEGELKKFAKRENPFVGLDFSLILADWEKYYREIHNLKTDFSGVRIPEASDEFSWLICRPEKFFAERAFSGGKKLYPKWKWTNKSLDDVLDMSFGRDGKIEPYVRVRPNWEADEDLKNLSANQIADGNINTLCLTERLLLGGFLYWKHQKYLDVKTITLCSGSRFADGFVPSVHWGEDCARMCVYWSYPGCADGVLRSRQVVS